MFKGCRTCYWTGYHYVPTASGKYYVRVPHGCGARIYARRAL